MEVELLYELASHRFDSKNKRRNFKDSEEHLKVKGDEPEILMAPVALLVLFSHS